MMYSENVSSILYTNTKWNIVKMCLIYSIQIQNEIYSENVSSILYTNTKWDIVKMCLVYYMQWKPKCFKEKWETGTVHIMAK